MGPVPTLPQILRADAARWRRRARLWTIAAIVVAWISGACAGYAIARAIGG